ncbi:PREDICTED: synaptogyrin-3 [Myotis davidii]|uniref:synaptogyrin-3 n=1 Tax=Myotis davidii TaxID=225400 RepID=UPI0007673659|nr:PREDICTED: synaptogyrin-3 [Myotis davidii]
MEGASFGAGLAGAAVDPVSFAKRPQTLLRVVSWLHSMHYTIRLHMLLFLWPIVNEGYVNSDEGPELRCVFNGNAGACRFGVTLVGPCTGSAWAPTCRSLPPNSCAARAAIAFSFFSILSWVALTLKALHRFRLGTDMSIFATEQLGTGAGQDYPGYPVGSGVEGTETYQSPPFTETLDTSPKGYQVPAY